jgi:hypothetical protein
LQARTAARWRGLSIGGIAVPQIEMEVVLIGH